MNWKMIAGIILVIIAVILTFITPGLPDELIAGALGIGLILLGVSGK